MKNKYPEIRLSGYDTEWSMKKLGDITDIKDSSRISNALWISNGVPYLRSSDLSNDNIKGELFLSKKTYKEYSAKTGAPTRGDLLFTSGGKIGVTYYKENDDELYVQGGSILYAKTSESEHLDGRFLKTYFDTPILKKYIENASTGLTIKHFTLKPAKDTPIAIPGLDEQKKIGLFFKDLDDTISLHQKELDALKQTKQGFLQKMFPREEETVPEIRFSGFEDEWNEYKLGDIMKVTSVKRIHQSDWTDSGVRFLRARDIVSVFNKKKVSDYLYISTEKYEEYSLISGKVSKNDILVTGVGSIGVPLLITDDNPIYFKDGNIIWFKNKDTINGYFLYYSFVGYKIQKFIKNIAGIGTVGTYTIDSGKKTPILLPSEEEQKKIGEFFKQLDEVIDLKEQEFEALKKTKQGFLQKMFI